jgi:hypothetical protein
VGARWHGIGCLAPRKKLQQKERLSTAERRPRRGISYCGYQGCQGPRKCKDCHCIYMRQWRYAGREKSRKTGQRTQVRPADPRPNDIRRRQMP